MLFKNLWGVVINFAIFQRNFLKELQILKEFKKKFIFLHRNLPPLSIYRKLLKLSIPSIFVWRSGKNNFPALPTVNKFLEKTNLWITEARPLNQHLHSQFHKIAFNTRMHSEPNSEPILLGCVPTMFLLNLW